MLDLSWIIRSELLIRLIIIETKKKRFINSFCLAGVVRNKGNYSSFSFMFLKKSLIKILIFLISAKDITNFCSVKSLLNMTNI